MDENDDEVKNTIKQVPVSEGQDEVGALSIAIESYHPIEDLNA